MNSYEMDASRELDLVAKSLMEARKIADYRKALQLAREANPKLSYAYDGKIVAPGGFAEVYKPFLKNHARDDGRMQVRVYGRDDHDRGDENELHSYDRDIGDVISQAKQAVSASGGS